VKRWKPVLIGAGVFLGLSAAFVIWVNVVAARRWEETLRRTDEIEKELAAPPPARRPLRGEPLPGNARDDYAAARSPALAWDVLNEMNAYLEGGTVDREKVRGGVAALAPSIQKLREGGPPSMSPGTSIDKFVAVQAARARARLDVERDETRAAFELLADLIRVGQDEAASAASVSGVLSGYEKTSLAAQDLMTALGEQVKATEGLDVLEREMAELDVSVPPAGRVLLLKRVDLARAAEAGPFTFSRVMGGTGWRYGYSGRLHVAATLERIEQWARVVHERRDRPWREIDPVYLEAKSEAARTSNEFLDIEAAAILMEGYAWILRARLRLIRAAAAYRRSGEKLSIDDPYGGTLSWDHVGLRSRGPTDAPKDDIILRLKP
jgi:hypothetical protein